MLLGLPEFDVLRANTIAEACALLSKYGDEARVLAGGTDLLVKMKNKGTLPRYLINVKRIPNLDQIAYEEPAGLRIGALTTIQAIKDSSVIAHYFPMLSQAAGKVGTLQIRNLGTIGGNLANASPAAEFAPVLLTLGASVKCAGPEGERVIAMDEFFLGPGKTSLRGNEMLTEIVVPNLPPHAAGIYLKHSLRGMDVAIVSAAVVIHLDGEVCRDAMIALGAVAPTPFRARKAEALLNGRKLRGSDDDNELFDEVARVAAGESVPIDDLRAYTTYRKKVAENLSRQALEQAIALAR
jgi:carbon-monoxide dehydrogenase medium subunit